MNWTNVAAVAVVVAALWYLRPVWKAVGRWLSEWGIVLLVGIVVVLSSLTGYRVSRWVYGVNSAVRRVEAVEKSLNTPKEVCFHITPTGWESCGITYGPDGVVGCRRIGGSATAKEVYLRLSSRLDAIERKVDRKMDRPRTQACYGVWFGPSVSNNHEQARGK